MPKKKEREFKDSRPVRKSEFDPEVSLFPKYMRKGWHPPSQISKDYGWSAKRMNTWLNEKGVQFYDLMKANGFLPTMEQE